MARLIPSLILFFCFSLLLSSSHARSPLPTADQQKDDSELESVILLPSDKLPESDPGSTAEIEGDGEENRVGAEKLSDEQPENDEGEKESPEKANWREIRSRHQGAKFGGVDQIRSGEEKRVGDERFSDEQPENDEGEKELPEKANWREIRFRHRGAKFGGGDEIRSGRMPFWKERNDAVDEEHYRHHHHHHHRGPHGEMFAGRWIGGARFAGGEGEPMMKGEFKQPEFFFHRHHHRHGRHQHHRHGDFEFYRGEERQGGGFWNAVGRFFGGN